MIPGLTTAQVQEVRETFAPIARWSGLPIVPDRLDGRRVVTGEGVASLVKFADPMVSASGLLGGYFCYSPGIRRFAIGAQHEGADLEWRVSLNSIGVMVNPTDLSAGEFAELCYRFLLALEAGEPLETQFLDEPVLWPKTVTRGADLVGLRHAIPDLRPTETVVYARDLFGTSSFVARLVPGVPWRDLDWRAPDGRPVNPPTSTSNLESWRTWRTFLREFLRHPVAFTRDAEGRRSDGSTRGSLTAAPILIAGINRTGRTSWTTGERAESLLPDPGEWARVLEGLSAVSGADLRRAGLAPQSVRAWRKGRRPSRRNVEAARRLVAQKARADAGLAQARGRRCVAPGCSEFLIGRQRSFCTLHASSSGPQRQVWREAAR